MTQQDFNDLKNIVKGYIDTINKASENKDYAYELLVKSNRGPFSQFVNKKEIDSLKEIIAEANEIIKITSQKLISFNDRTVDCLNKTMESHKI